MSILRAILVAPVMAMLIVCGGPAAAVADPVPIPSRELHAANHGAIFGDDDDWVAIAQSTDNLNAVWRRLSRAGELPTIDFGLEFVVVTSRIVPCLMPPHDKSVWWEDSILVVRVSEEPTTTMCPSQVGRVDWAAAVARDALPGDVTAAVFIGPDGDELARIDVSIDGPPSPEPEPEPTLPETGLPLAAPLALALASLLTGGALTLRAGRGQSASLGRKQLRARASSK